MSTNPPNEPWSNPPPSPPPPPPGGGYPGGGYPGGGYPGGGYPGGDPGWGQQPPTGYLAGWWHRVGATIIDGILLAIPVVVVTLAASRAGGGVLGIVIEAVYFTIMFSRRGQTVGNMAVGTRVVDARTGGPLSTGKAFGRWAAQFMFGIGAFLFFIPTLIDYLWPLWDSQNQTLHDKMAGTVVIRT